jgi:hypothetical protein
MRPEEFRAFLREQPFRPIRVTLTDGRTYDIRHPELALVARGIIVVGIPGKDESEFPDHTVTLSLLHVMQVEHLESLKAMGGNANGKN